MRNKTSLAASAALLAVALVVTPAQAQDTVARNYSMMPKDGMAAQFEVALKNHLEWRRANGDPWTWLVSTLETGQGLGEVSVRTSGHSFADFDAYDADFGPKGLQHFQATVSPLLESVSSTIDVTNESISKRPPEGRTLGFVTVNTFHIRPHMQQQFNEVVNRANQILIELDWPYYWVWTSPVSGNDTGPQSSVVVLYENWAEMAEPDPPMLAVLAQEMGQDGFEEWLAAFNESIRGQEVYTRRIRADLAGS